MAERAEAAANAGESRDQVLGWLTVLIQDFTELSARAEDLEKRST
jgi:hypothetical protein